ncbi:MAG: hypothetical protein E7404_06025 [Ruminococcaceae bacterium]|nr:hypothetical protein [Oscillospiraceae bacterium]
MENIVIKRRCILTPQEDTSWASYMVLNPSILIDNKNKRIHMLVRTTGPYEEKRFPEKPLPYPIFLAYGYSDDDGENFTFDFEKPALAPQLNFELDDLYTKNIKGEKVPAYMNGCIEDPRMFWVEDECYLTVATRMFPPGPFWEHDDPQQCMPQWAKDESNPFSTQKNPTVTLLYKVNLDALYIKDYDKAFTYVTNLTSPEKGEDRDVFLFPEKMKIDGKMQYVMIHRPYCPYNYDGFTQKKPSIMISCADSLFDFANNANKRKILYSPTESWQKEKVGGSTPPVKMGNGEWLLNFHGKEDEVKGYAQSFMILKEVDNDFPKITHLCKEKWITDTEDFEKPNKSKTPAVFFTDIDKNGDKLIVSYGAADEKACYMELDYNKLIKELRKHTF